MHLGYTEEEIDTGGDKIDSGDVEIDNVDINRNRSKTILMHRKHLKLDRKCV